MSKPTALLQGTLYLLILKILALGPRTGWPISQRLEQMSNEVLQVSHGSLYPALHKLETEGWVRGEWKESDTGRQAKFYSLTRAGRKQLLVERENWTRLSVAINGRWPCRRPISSAVSAISLRSTSAFVGFAGVSVMINPMRPRPSARSTAALTSDFDNPSAKPTARIP